jgi:ribosomal protein L24E
MSLNTAFDALAEYAKEQGITIADALCSIKQHQDFPKANRGRPRKANKENVSPSNRPKGRPPKDAEWSDEDEMYINSDGTEYIKEEKTTSAKPRGKPPKDTEWSDEDDGYIYQDGSKYNKVEKTTSTKPRGRPPKGTEWSEESGSYINKSKKV